MSNHNYDWPPSNTEEAEEWSDDHHLDAIAYAAGWSASGMGYVDQARKEWPLNPGFDFTEGLPDWDTGIEEDADYEYRTSLLAGGTAPKETPDGWVLVASFMVNPEPELYDEDGSPSGYMYVGEDNREAVYRKPLWDEDEDED
jgi:hypothetical protein